MKNFLKKLTSFDENLYVRTVDSTFGYEVDIVAVVNDEVV